MPASLLDAVDLAELRDRARRAPTPAAGALAILLAGRAIVGDPSDPDWEDRDRLVVEEGPLAELGRGAGCGVVTAAGEQLLGTAVEVARDSAGTGGQHRVWVMLDVRGGDHGWDAAGTAAMAGLGLLTAVDLAGPTFAARFDAAGWRLARAALDPVLLLAACDHLLDTAPVPGVVLVTPEAVSD